MMNKKLLMLVCFIVLTACGTEEGNDSSSADEEEVVQPEVEVVFDEEPLPVDEETPIQAIVTADGEPVKDADYVEFEIWEDTEREDTSETLEAEHTEDGVYELMYEFEEDGTYQVIAHTQARDVHTMPQVEVQAGDDSSHEEDEHEEGSHAHEDGEFAVHLIQEELSSEENSELLAHIEQNGEPFEQGEVSFEISSDQLDKHEFIEAEEVEPGAYQAEFDFPAAGGYLINVHYEKPEEDIHGHKEEEVKVD
ncbi:FixH family protein [Halobacillus sp. A5]|uniref:FixH family protein n=1 Tax=Halobacillus sp. A5 TaxID=2880263 RepID=UPI0020A629B3|nr:FixH family protein [Halobacillus sp. A5]MCP3029037.1 FixH family protein [Halobacillus sp. A5]